MSDTAHHDHHHCKGHHGHSHHGSVTTGRRFAIAIALNISFVIIEVVYGYITHSMALIADAGHNLFDVFGLLLASWSVMLMRRRPDNRYTYGLHSSSILAALFNALLLLIACAAIVWEAMNRFFVTPEVTGLTVSVVAAIGIAINGFSAWLFVSGSKTDLNIRGAFLHMAADAVVSLGVVIAGISMFYTGYYWIDPLVSLIIVAIIVIGTWGLLRDSVNLALNAVPPHIDSTAVKKYLSTLPHVTDVHDLHIWAMSTQANALTAHLVIPSGHPGDAFMETITRELSTQFSIGHSTIQIELGNAHHRCSLDKTNG